MSYTWMEKDNVHTGLCHHYKAVLATKRQT